jgi:hypothetical protein
LGSNEDEEHQKWLDEQKKIKNELQGLLTDDVNQDVEEEDTGPKPEDEALFEKAMAKVTGGEMPQPKAEDIPTEPEAQETPPEEPKAQEPTPPPEPAQEPLPEEPKAQGPTPPPEPAQETPPEEPKAQEQPKRCLPRSQKRRRMNRPRRKR